MGIFKKAQPKPTLKSQAAAYGGLVVTAYAIHVGVQVLDAVLRGAAVGAKTAFSSGKAALAARKSAAENAAATQAEAAAPETTPETAQSAAV